MEYHDLASKKLDNRYLKKFKKWCGNYDIYFYSKSEQTEKKFVFYISKQKINDFKNLGEKSIGYIECTIDFDDKDVFINWVNTKNKFQGKGIGTFLIILSCTYIKHLKKYKIKKILLDDDTDNSWNMKKNIYIKLGFKYINEEPEPEMIGIIDKISNNWTKFFKNKPELI